MWWGRGQAADLERRLQDAHTALDSTQGELRESQATAERRLQVLLPSNPSLLRA